MVSAFAPILNAFKLDTAAPVEVFPGHHVQRATNDQITRIRECLEELHSFKGFGTREEYECKYVVQVSTTDGSTGTFEQLPESEWRYNVVTYSSQSSPHHQLALLSNVSDVQLEIPIWLGEHGFGGYVAKASHYVSTFPRYTEQPPRVNEAMLRDIWDAHEEMLAIEKAFPEIKRALRLFDDLKSLPHESSYEILGLFAIIEMLITHNPKGEDVGDSITHQMKAKVPLLSKRFRRPLTYSEFGDLPENKVWERLYQYRSMLAHGSVVTFERGDLSALKTPGDALRFLREAVRALLRHSFKEPQLYRDLKEC